MKTNSLYLLAALQLPKFGRAKALSLVKFIESSNAGLQSESDLLCLLEECKQKNLIKALGDYSADEISKAVKKADLLINKSESMGIRMIGYFDDDFPVSLKRIVTDKGRSDAPVILWYKGNIGKLNQSVSVAVIGTRKPTPEGIKSGNYIAEYLANRDCNIVSGLAYGCDKSGHEGALKAHSGFTTAILAHGLDTVYPKEHAQLARQILEQGGILLSEYPIGTRCMAGNFVERDRLQSGLAQCCVVIQTSVAGGTMHAANASISNNKPVYAVSYNSPKLMLSDVVEGNLMLINKGMAQPLSSLGLENLYKSISNQ